MMVFTYLSVSKCYMLPYFLFILYLGLFCWLVPRIAFVQQTGLSKLSLISLLLLNVMAGIAVGWTALHFTGIDNDYWDANKFGWEEYQLLIHRPDDYFNNLFHSQYENGYHNVFDSYASYWNDLRNNLIIKFISILDIFTRGNYYVNSIFFSVLAFFGHIALYRVFLYVYPENKKLVLIGCFLLPSMLFYAAGMHKDSLVFFFLGMISLLLYEMILLKKQNSRRWIYLLFLIAFLFLIRNFIVLALVPAMVAFCITEWKKWPAFRVFFITYAITALLFFNSSAIIPSFNLPDTIAKRQWDFKNQPWAGVGKTDIYLTTLYPNFRSFVNNTPQAINHAMMRPYISEYKTISLFPFAMELFFYQCLFILFLLFRKKEQATQSFVLFGLFFALLVYLNIGYTIPNIGSIIRYRSLYLPFLITPLLCGINWEKCLKIIQFKK